tara:strand:- start:2341 stop:2742 length:402 start_codon:yes stop_codon:yes gene_type:complete
VKPTKADRKKFDLDLKYGQKYEDEFLNIVVNSKVEVKTERGMWMDTGNIAIEYESYGKPSGIMATESDYWLQNLCYKGCICLSFFIKVEHLKKLIEQNTFPSVSGGDHNASKMYLLKLNLLTSPDILRKLVDE